LISKHIENIAVFYLIFKTKKIMGNPMVNSMIFGEEGYFDA